VKTETALTDTARTTAAKISSHESELASALAHFRENSRVTRITIAVGNDACTEGRKIQGTYQKDLCPRIPIEACSRPGGCTCGYLPVLKEIFP